MKSFDAKITADFYDNKEKKKTPKIYSNCVCWAVIALDSVHRKKNNKYYLQIHLKQCKCEKKM